MTEARAVCVYCGSQTGVDSAFADYAHRFGQALADNGYTLVFGGGGRGLTGAVARGCLESGGKAVGIIHDALRTAENAYPDLSSMRVTHTMHDRKRELFEHSDAFVVFPGGLGTLEELVEVACWHNLTFHKKPIVLANLNNYWAPFLDLLSHFEQAEFLSPKADLWGGPSSSLHVVDAFEDLIPTVTRLITEAERVGADEAELQVEP